MEISPLPTQDSDLRDSDQQSTHDDLNHYVVRITAYDKFTYEELKQRIDEEPYIFRYVISQEVTPQVHYHLVLTTDESFDIQQMKDLIRAFITPLWHDPDTHKLPRGFGNKQYNCQIALDLDQAISYCLKERKEYNYIGYTEDYINQRIEASFKKHDTKTFNLELQELQKKFQESDMDMPEYMTAFIRLKSRYNQMVNMQHAYQYALSQLLQRNPEQADSFVINYLYKQ